MRAVAILLVMVATGLYAWPHVQIWLSEGSHQALLAPKHQAEVFVQAMQSIRPVSDLSAYIEEKNAQEKAQHEAYVAQQKEHLAQEEANALQNELKDVAQKTLREDDLQEKEREQLQQAGVMCLRLGPVVQAQLPAINRSIEDEKLLERVNVEPVLGPDRWVVFIIPTTTTKGARALAQQVKRAGFKDARVITSGPLLNAVELANFPDESSAQTFLKDAQKKVKVGGIRATRIIGEPTQSVYLIFTPIDETAAESVYAIGRRHQQKVSDCF